MPTDNSDGKVTEALAILRQMSSDELGRLKLAAEEELNLCPNCWRGSGKWCCYESYWDD